jgi:hypothetical protein
VPITRCSWIELNADQRGRLEEWARDGSGYRVLSSTDLSSVLPSGLHPKVQSAVLMTVPTSTGGIYVLVNSLRVDARAWTIDQEPFGAIIDSTGARSVGLFLHHGRWAGRTIVPSTDSWDHVEQSGIGAYYPLPNRPPGRSGHLSDLIGTGHQEAFEEFKLRVRSTST